jgi:hypothetical protein
MKGYFAQLWKTYRVQLGKHRIAQAELLMKNNKPIE